VATYRGPNGLDAIRRSLERMGGMNLHEFPSCPAPGVELFGHLLIAFGRSGGAGSFRAPRMFVDEQRRLAAEDFGD
jgi:hypothetical protein